MEGALAKFGDMVATDFRLHIRESVVEGRPLPSLELQLIPKQRTFPGPTTDELASRLGSLIAANVYVAADTTLEDLVKSGDFCPLKIEFVAGFPAEPFKPRRIVPHL